MFAVDGVGGARRVVCYRRLRAGVCLTIVDHLSPSFPRRWERRDEIVVKRAFSPANILRL